MSRFYVLAYSRSTGRLLELVESVDAEDAMACRSEWERNYCTAAGGDVEVAVFNASSLEELKRTHPRYFRTLAEMTPTG